ncbi:proline-rich receptor-like protein kinase PERK2 [Bradysia coprophila]|uniref:proline-rich receptor-like protein kinase PERK2 n=1 Tax=Bradysia coprophila TaxID=38358 RepID=UPI00187D89E4|nr:proline-rich receptor-like protein kinase PERK2 [Bradysia coprophila]
MSKILLLIVGFISFVQAAPSADPCIIILPPPRPSATVPPATSVTPEAPSSTEPTLAPVTPIATTAPTPVPAGPPALTPEQLATLMELYNMYLEFLKSQQQTGPAPVPFPPPA